jgi:hypothetical protein
MLHEHPNNEESKKSSFIKLLNSTMSSNSIVPVTKASLENISGSLKSDMSRGQDSLGKRPRKSKNIAQLMPDLIAEISAFATATMNLYDSIAR